MKKFDFNQKRIFENGKKYEVKFVGNELVEDIDYMKVNKLMNKFIDNFKLHMNMNTDISFIRTILRDFDEKLLEVKYENIDKKESISYKNKKMLFYKCKRKHEVYGGINVIIDIDIELEKEVKISFISPEDISFLDYSDLINGEKNLLYDIDILKDIKDIKLSMASKELIEIYKLFFNQFPDFSEDINIRVQSMMSILSMFNIILDMDYSFMPITDKKIPSSIALYQVIFNLYPFGEISTVEDPVKITEDNVKVIKLVGEQIRNSVPKNMSLDEYLIQVSKIAFASRYGITLKSYEEKICDYTGYSMNEVKNVIDIFELINKKIYE